MFYRWLDYDDYEDVGQHFEREREKIEMRLFKAEFKLLRGQVDHLAKVQMLILKDLGKEHRVEPAREVLVSIGNLSDLKKPKGRSA